VLEIVYHIEIGSQVHRVLIYLLFVLFTKNLKMIGVIIAKITPGITHKAGEPFKGNPVKMILIITTGAAIKETL
jgi:hypothetical protein